MYSDSIKKKQQELLDVLLKKASGKNIIPARDLIQQQAASEGTKGNGYLTQAQIDTINNIKNMSKEELHEYDSRQAMRRIDDYERELEYRRRMEDIEKARKSGWGGYEDDYHKLRNLERYYYDAPKAHREANDAQLANFLKTTQNNYQAQKPGLNKHISTVTPKQSVDTSSLKPSVNNSAPVLPVIKSGSYMKKLANDTNQNNGGFGLGLSNVDWDKMKNDTINLIRNHKLETLGGAGGLVLGSLFGGNSFAERMLMAGLGTLAGGGLGHLVSKYKN